MKRILVPTDYSSLSANALDFATDLARASGAEIHLVHFLNVPIEPATFTELLQVETDSRRDFFSDINLAEHRRRLTEITESRSNSGIKIIGELGGSGVISGSVKYVNTFSIDLIVLGADDVEEERGEFPVRFSEELTRFVKIPVISLTALVDYVDLTKVVLGIDPMKQKDLASLGRMIGPILSSLDAQVYLVDVVKAGEPDHDKRAEQLNVFGHAAQLQNFKVQVLEHENDLEGLLLVADQLGAGLIAVVSDGKPDIFRFFKDSFATSVVKATDLPVLVFNSNA